MLRYITMLRYLTLLLSNRLAVCLNRLVNRLVAMQLYGAGRQVEVSGPGPMHLRTLCLPQYFTKIKSPSPARHLHTSTPPHLHTSTPLYSSPPTCIPPLCRSHGRGQTRGASMGSVCLQVGRYRGAGTGLRPAIRGLTHWAYMSRASNRTH
ncbi:hypothetical protein B484DRAFT_453003 [Ochromonadaceae sp. CCMP2298]|nr:hypothetical protein B484DRAFT_453003 [Ochromonadaceae sp. CCMP2298]